ncbi:MAG: L,D-transpeptidase family protein [Akkermansiaceae bacterium]
MKFNFLGFFAVLLVSCGSSNWQAGAKQAGYSKKYFKYRAATPEETIIKVSLWDQKAWLLNSEGEAILEADIATGVENKETPEGVFQVLERMESKRSNQYGRIVNRETREVVIEKSWEHQGPLPEGTEYEGIEMPYWMRLTWDGIGMHVGEFKKRTRCSFGCIRVYEKAQPLIFAKTQLGTEIEVVQDSLRGRYSW